MKRTILSFILVVCFPVLALADHRWIFEISGGSAHSFGTTLQIEQEGNHIELDADYATKPFEDALYYAWRVARTDGKGAWEVELIHHKLYLENPQPPVQHFEVTHGYNMLLVNRSVDFRGFALRAGGGVVIAHPETEVSGIFGPSEYHLTGPAAQFGAQKRFYLSKRFFAAVEGKLTLSRARVPIANGNADVPNAALHGLFGIGFVL